MTVLLTPTIGGMFIDCGKEEVLHEMSGDAMLSLAECLLSAARRTLKAEAAARARAAELELGHRPMSRAEATHALK